MTRIAIIGAGSGGAMTANILRRKLQRDKADITVIDKSDTHYYQPSYYLLPFDYMMPEAQMRPVDDLLKPGIDFHQDEVTGVDPDEQVVECAGENVEYDYLIVVSGHVLEPETVPGMTEGWQETDEVFPYYHYDAATDMSDAVDEFDGGTFLVTVPDTPIKCAGAPLKMSMLMEDYMSRTGIREDSRVIMTKPGEAVFGVEPYKSKMEEIWADRDIEFVPNFSVAEVDHENRVVRSTDGDEIEYDMYAPVSPQYGADSIAENSPLTEGGDPVTFDKQEGIYSGDPQRPPQYVTVDQHTLQHTEYDNVFALGDCDSAPKSRTASAARKQAPVVAKNLIAHMEGEPMRGHYDGYAACPLLTQKGKAVIAEFDYEDALSAPVESRANWVLDVNVLPATYWNMWMKGYDPAPV
ncbi:NAD(P)/FAD-dependent oxidoreductase [Haladaptatus paucihalophilus]|uniref:Sulfide:quinone oxidoreductase n=2 Tax=Haladaptatus paucihalophilus DX253 TaxID=797209 RepID=A0A1M7C4F3_HALPU|nr:FAD-dependent oxidoreductase [Haladaptatus paucihalophilus]SHL62053.1 sulfide:quinone oxidoreductase [Haladaptatus paucihalophilus DX253]